ncbi:hypothetical protein Taro_013494 [Colocasia esculenta]|uniref:Retrotransposon gag domain-containing protein n=1 Tax=Colocasia esculenta TaxID=4460 RepID=A0A843U6N5_COLES|nr:hypothetical protein [Colocasia esculenta]
MFDGVATALLTDVTGVLSVRTALPGVRRTCVNATWSPVAVAFSVFEEEVSVDESVAQPQAAAVAAAAAGGQQQQEYQPQLQQYADWFPLAEQFFRNLYQGAYQPGQAATGVQFSVPPPVVPEQQVEPVVEQPEHQQRSGTGSTQAGRRRTAVTEDRTALLERFLCLRPPMFHGEYDPDKAESWTHKLECIFETMECAEEDQVRPVVYQLKGAAHEWWRVQRQTHFQGQRLEHITWQWFSEVFHGEYFHDYARRSDQACAERFIAGLRPDLRWGVTAHMCTTLGEAVAKATTLDRETWQPQQQQQQQQGGASSSRSASPGLQSSQLSKELSRAVRRKFATPVAYRATSGGIAPWGKPRSSSSQFSTLSNRLSTSTLLSSRHRICSRGGSTSSKLSSFRSRSSTSLEVEGHQLPAKLYALQLFDIDVILGMDWLEAHSVVVDFQWKTVRFRIPREPVLCFRGIRSTRGLSRRVLVATTRAIAFLSRRFGRHVLVATSDGIVTALLTDVTGVLSVRTALQGVRRTRVNATWTPIAIAFPDFEGTCSCRLERGGGVLSYEKAPTGSFFAWRLDFSAATAGRAPGGGDGAVILLDVDYSPSESPDPWAVIVKIGSSAWAEGQLLELSEPLLFFFFFFFFFFESNGFLLLSTGYLEWRRMFQLVCTSKVANSSQWFGVVLVVLPACSRGAWHLRACPVQRLSPFPGTPILGRLLREVWDAEGFGVLSWRRPDSPLSHCLSLRWFRSHVVVSGVRPQLGQAAVLRVLCVSVAALSRPCSGAEVGARLASRACRLRVPLLAASGSVLVAVVVTTFYSQRFQVFLVARACMVVIARLCLVSMGVVGLALGRPMLLVVPASVFSQFRGPILGCQPMMAPACVASRPGGVFGVRGGSACGPSTL